MQIKAKELIGEVGEFSEPVDSIEQDEPFIESIEESDVEESAVYQTQKERKTSNVVLAILGVFLLAFIVTMIVVFCVKGSVPDTLIMCTMGGSGLEALVLAGIKVSKVLAGCNPGSDPPDGVG